MTYFTFINCRFHISFQQVEASLGLYYSVAFRWNPTGDTPHCASSHTVCSWCLPFKPYSDRGIPTTPMAVFGLLYPATYATVQYWPLTKVMPESKRAAD